MLAALLLLLALVIGTAAMLLVQPDTGYVLIGYGPWEVETSLTVLVIGVALWFVAVYALIKFGSGLLRLPGRLRAAVTARQRERARNSFEKGMMHLLEGRWKQAELELVRHAGDHSAAHLNYLGAARAAQRLGADERRDHYLTLASEHAPSDLRSAILITRAELQRERGDHLGAKTTAEQLTDIDRDHPYAVELRAEAHAALGEWQTLRDLLLEPRAAEALEPSYRRGLLLRALHGLIAAAVAGARLDALKSAWESAGELQDDPALRRDYVRGLGRLGADAEAAAVAGQALDRDWDAGVATAYAELELPDPLSQLSSIEAWLQAYGEHPELLTAAGRACMRQRLWGKARSYLESALRLQPTPQVYLALAQLAEATQQPEEAARRYREGLDLAAGETR